MFFTFLVSGSILQVLVSENVGQSQLRRLRCLGMWTPLLLHAASEARSMIASRASRMFLWVCLMLMVTQKRDVLLCETALFTPRRGRHRSAWDMFSSDRQSSLFHW